jgi:hypothetical protein
LNHEYDSLVKPEIRLGFELRRAGMRRVRREIESNPARIRAIALRETHRVNPLSSLPA